MGERELYTGARLETGELLGFICDHPDPSDILVGFSFGYDVTMILRDLAQPQLARLFQPKTFGAGRSPFTWFGEFDIDYLPKQYLRVRRTRRVRQSNGTYKRVGIEGSTRVIYEVFGNFQKSFLKVITEFDAGTPEQRELIRQSKEQRGSDDWAVGQVERDYCALECQLLAEVMDKFRSYCEAADIIPKTWNGAGKLSKALLRKHDTPKAVQVASWTPEPVLDLANLAYYGGRFEITRTGLICEAVHEYDIGSAYPDATRRLPCLEHGRWREADVRELAATDRLFVALAGFTGPVRSDGDQLGQLGSLPVRSRDGHLYWPRLGSGIYWSVELRSAERRGVRVRYKGGWVFEPGCDCVLFDWMEPLFEYRKSIGKSGPGHPMKLGYNGVYGAMAQRVGAGLYANMIYAGLITAITRARINDAIAQAPGQVAMIATDGVYSLVPLDLDVGDQLGQWEHNQLDGLFIVQPGLYWCPERRKRKSRGLSGSFFEQPGRTEAFERAWSDYMARGAAGEFPAVEVPVPGFTGLKLAHARGKLETAGRWVEEVRSISFDPRNKRYGHQLADGHIITGMRAGSPGLVSLPHREFLARGGAEPWEHARAMLEDQPDVVDLSPPFQD